MKKSTAPGAFIAALILVFLVATLASCGGASIGVQFVTTASEPKSTVSEPLTFVYTRETNNYTATTKKYTYTTRYRPKKSTTTEYDSYHAADYYGEDDFYEDYYDEFDDYYDAEEYWREHQD